MPSETKSYDLVIIGGGPAGIIAASTAISLKKKVALIDSHRDLGGAACDLGERHDHRGSAHCAPAAPGVLRPAGGPGLKVLVAGAGCSR